MGHDNQSKAAWHADMDTAEHNRTYDGFVKLTKIGIVLLVLLLIAMRVFLVPFAS